MFEIGRPVLGDEFIGRSKCIERIFQIISSNNNHCIEIIGLPYVGKTSIVHEAIYRLKNINEGNSYLFVEYSCKKNFDYSCIHMIINSIEKTLFERTFKYNDAIKIKTELQQIKQRIESGTDYDENCLIRVLSVLYNNYNIKFYLIMDDADNAPINLGYQIEQLIPLIDSHFFNIISVSRSRLKWLFPPEQAIGSKYPYRFSDLVSIPVCDIGSIKLYKEIVNKNCNTVISDGIWNKFIYYSGENPYFLSLIGNYIENSIIEYGEITHEINMNLLGGHYQDVINKWHLFLLKTGILNELVNWIFNNGNSIQNAINYGIITEKQVFTIPYINQILYDWYKKEQYNDENQLSELNKNLSAILEINRQKVYSLFGRGNNEIVIRIKRLEAIQRKIQTAKDLDEMQTDIKIPISEDEYLDYKLYLGESRNQFENIG